MSVIYTRSGDTGNTRTVGNKKISKASLHPEVLGHIDELNVMVGWVKVACMDGPLKKKLHQVQSNLFEIASVIACHKGEKEFLNKGKKYSIEINQMEEEIDLILENCGPLNRFLYPGNDDFSTRWHMARVVCRRAERNIVKLSERYDVPAIVLAYVNRLSDWLFMQAYKAGKEALTI